MSTHNLCFRAKIRKKCIPCKLSFTVLKWGVRGYTLHGLVIMMKNDVGEPCNSVQSGQNVCFSCL